MESRQGKGKENTSDVVYILAIKTEPMLMVSWSRSYYGYINVEL